jgi:hypothetical protein
MSSTPASMERTGAARRLMAARQLLGGGLLAVFVWSVSAGVAEAAPGWMRNGQNPVEPQTLVRPPGITMDQAANMVRRETGGRVLSASPVERGGQRGYEIRVLVDGKRVKNVFVDAHGRIRSRD